MTERLSLDPQTRRWLKLEVSRRRREKELHVGRPVLHRYSKQAVSDALDLPQASPSRNHNSLGVSIGPSEPGIGPRGRNGRFFSYACGEACVCGHVRNRRDHQLSGAAPCGRRRHTDGRYTVPRRTRGRRERARAKRPVRRPGTRDRRSIATNRRRIARARELKASRREIRLPRYGLSGVAPAPPDPY